jgi:succinoglycan biosynthesis transport protein ExoP
VETDNQIQLLEVRLKTLSQERSKFEQDASQFPEVTRQYTDIQQKLELTKQTLNQLLAQREKLRVEAAQDNVPWELISPPQIPRDSATGQAVPVPADSSKKLLVGIAGGLMLGLGVAIALEKWRDIFYTSDDIQDAVQPPILGKIPIQKALAMPSNSLAVSEMALERAESALDPQFLDAFDALYANIRFLYANAPIRALTICSAEVEDGKSAIALHLACTVANMGQRVLLVDANLRQPQLHNPVGISNRKGLSELLTDKLVPNALVEPSLFADNLFVLNAGNPSAKSIKLLGSAQMQYIAEEFQATFDLVIYDTPALGDVMDAIFLTAQTDGILMVVGVKKTRQSNTLKTLDQLNAFRLPCLGIVANHTQARTSSEVPPEFHNSTLELGEEISWETSEGKPHEGSRVFGTSHKVRSTD